VRQRLPLVLLLLAISNCSAEREPRSAGPWRRFDLTQEPPLSGGAAIQPRSLALGVLDPVPPAAARWEGRGALVRGISQVANSTATWKLRLGDTPNLSFTPLSGPAGGHRKITIRSTGDTAPPRVLFDAETKPMTLPAPARIEIGLGDLARREIELTFETSGDPAGPRVTWGSPELAWRAESAARRVVAPRPNILLIGLDTVRADAVGARPGKPSLTPALDELAAESDVFLDAYSTFNVTNPSFASIFTGLYGKHHGAYELTPPGLSPEHTTLAEILAAAGYRTAAVISARFLGAPESGIAQGFEKVRRPEDSTFAAENAAAIAMQQLDDRPEPFFLFLHLFDAHTPHTPPMPFAEGRRPGSAPSMAPVEEWTPFRPLGPRDFEDWRIGGARDLYDGEIAYLDREVGRLLDFLRSRGLLERTLVAVVADHGENLNEHGVSYRHAGLFESTTHVPLLVRRPGPPRAGRRIAGLVQTIDLFPTLLKAAGIPVPAQDGLDLDELFAGGRSGRRVVFAEHASHQGAMVRNTDYRLSELKGMPFLADGAYFYDTTNDPQELENLAGRGLPEEAELGRILEAWLADAGHAKRGASTLSEEEEKELRALGYLP
jgi:arylsulfatase A-like enzyme